MLFGNEAEKVSRRRKRAHEFYHRGIFDTPIMGFVATNKLHHACIFLLPRTTICPEFSPAV